MVEKQDIAIEHVSWWIDKKMPPIINDINLIFEPEHFYGILGPNGAGKSSLVRIILGLQKQTSGNVCIGNKCIKNMKRQEIAQKIAFVPQAFSRNIEFGVYDVVAMGREPHRKAFQGLTRQDHEIIEDALDLVQCVHLKDRKLANLSGGEMQRVMIARAIAQDTPWILLDEPISNLDIKHQVSLMDTFKMLHEKRGKSIVAILHDLNIANEYCDEIVFMKDGAVCHKVDENSSITGEILYQVYDMYFQFISDQAGRKYIAPDNNRKRK